MAPWLLAAAARWTSDLLLLLAACPTAAGALQLSM